MHKREEDGNLDDHVIFTASKHAPEPMCAYAGVQVCIKFLLGGSGIRQILVVFHRLIRSFPKLLNLTKTKTKINLSSL